MLATLADHHGCYLGFLNDIIRHLWPNIRVAGARMIKEIAEPMFGKMLPSPLNSLHFEKIDLGQTPIHFSNVDVHKLENEGIKLDLDLNWDGRCDIEMNGNMIPKFVSRWSKRRQALVSCVCVG